MLYSARMAARPRAPTMPPAGMARAWAAPVSEAPSPLSVPVGSLPLPPAPEPPLPPVSVGLEPDPLPPVSLLLSSLPLPPPAPPPPFPPVLVGLGAPPVSVPEADWVARVEEGEPPDWDPDCDVD